MAGCYVRQLNNTLRDRPVKTVYIKLVPTINISNGLKSKK